MTTGIKDVTRPLDAASVMALLGRRPRVLAVGEPTHLEDTLLDVRNELFRQLVEQEGYRAIALESDCLMGLVVDDYVTSGVGTLDEVMERGFSHEWGALEGNRALVRWMREHNAGRPAAEQVRFTAFDSPTEITHAASPRQALMGLHGYLASHVEAALLPCAADALDRLIGADERWTEQAAMRDPSRSVGHSAEAAELRLLADDLVALLDAQTPHLLAATTPDDWDRARLYGRAAVGLLRYHARMAGTGPARMTGLVAQRDAMMAANLLAFAERRPTFVYSHNLHLTRAPGTMRMDTGPVRWWSAGGLVEARLGADYAFLATAVGTIRHRGVDTPPAVTVEGLLHALPEDHFLVDARGLAAVLGGAPPAVRESPYFGYFPLDPAHLDLIDGLVYVRDLPRA
ncbi:Erythromycin esterase [Nonomuraea coxensis DSM 45129]|uniref:Erythromycin esterase n=1 Tax=Nonomuraea coxensis DSM 45129 TaxID=1122611 RepID=A0ABX8U112_9ACTN|nr:erythromycin esterase family protein [Nonomuraea coxensis]QYC41243.1 Erythromycin esterase [Nonomuraea coxensis DSM 45129]